MTTITDTTPQKTAAAAAQDLYRVLYRGALSLPDSYLQLDGLAFSARLPSRDTPCSGVQDSPSVVRARELMYNPLALALESMRGRQALRFKGTVRLQDVWTDDSGDVYMDVHPTATLTRIYFENVLCLAPLITYETGRRTQVGVRIALGDTDGPETTEIVVYGETSAGAGPLLPSTSTGPPPLRMRVARITPAPRVPRPDDPTPRKPPAHLVDPSPSDLGAQTRILARPSKGRATGKGKDKATDQEEDQIVRRAREVMLHLPRSKLRNKDGRDAMFKVPELPAKARRKPGDSGTDVFGAVEPPQARSVNGKVKGLPSRQESETGNAIEAANKLVLKKLTVGRLQEAGIPRTHPEFKDTYGFVYRGAAFALRSQLKTAHIGVQAAKAVVEAHVKMYVHDTPTSDSETPLSGGMTVD